MVIKKQTVLPLDTVIVKCDPRKAKGLEPMRMRVPRGYTEPIRPRNPPNTKTSK